MSGMTEKEKIAQVLAESSLVLRKVASERDEALDELARAKTKLAMVERRLTCEKLAADMHQKGLHTELEFNELVEDLEKAAEQGKLPVIQEAVKMSAPNMGNFHLNNDETRGSGLTDLESFLVGDVG